MEKEKCPDRLFNVYKTVYSSRYLAKLLRGVSAAAVAVSALSFAISLWRAWQESLLSAVLLAVSAAIPFSLVTAIRHIISAPRPYEVFDLSELTPENPHGKLGASFPSRHVFSAFLIGVVSLLHAPILGILTLALGLALALSRVALGIHFVRDVVCGTVIGIASGLIYVLIL